MLLYCFPNFFFAKWNNGWRMGFHPPPYTLYFLARREINVIRCSLTWLTAKSRSVSFSSQLIKICVFVWGGVLAQLKWKKKNKTNTTQNHHPKTWIFPHKKGQENRLCQKNPKQPSPMTLSVSVSCVYKKPVFPPLPRIVIGVLAASAQINQFAVAFCTWLLILWNVPLHPFAYRGWEWLALWVLHASAINIPELWAVTQMTGFCH